jgi:hypothetical protein
VITNQDGSKKIQDIKKQKQNKSNKTTARMHDSEIKVKAGEELSVVLTDAGVGGISRALHY